MIETEQIEIKIEQKIPSDTKHTEQTEQGDSATYLLLTLIEGRVIHLLLTLID